MCLKTHRSKEKAMDKKIEEADWVGLRLLYLTMALDGSSVTIPEVANIADYYTRKFGYDEIRKAFEIGRAHV